MVAQFDDIFGDIQIQFARVRNESVKATVNRVKLITAYNQRLTFRGLGPIGAGVSTALNVFYRVHPRVIFIVMENLISNIMRHFFDNYYLPV